MLNKMTLKDSIENAIKGAMTNALLETFNITEDISATAMADRFGAAACKCADSIADAIDSYIREASVLIPTGTTIPTAPGLISPAGPVTGSIVTLGPVFINDVIN